MGFYLNKSRVTASRVEILCLFYVSVLPSPPPHSCCSCHPGRHAVENKMADAWDDDDDDDFGTFECGLADSAGAAAAAAATVATPTKTPAWLLETQSIISSTEEFSRNTSKTSSKESLNNTTTAAAATATTTIAPPHESSSGDNLNKSAPSTFSDFLSSSAPTATPDPYQALREVVGATKSAKHLLDGTLNDGISFAATSLPTASGVAVVQETKQMTNAIKPPPVSEAPAVASSSSLASGAHQTNDLFCELQMKLLNAVTIKEQSELTLMKVREELSSVNVRVEQSLKLEVDRHQRELNDMKREHGEDMNEMHDRYKEIADTITKQLNSLHEASMKQQKLEYEKDVSEVTNKCLQLLEQQNECFKKQLKTTVNDHTQKYDEIKAELRKEFVTLIDSAAERITKQASESKGDMEALLKTSIDRELEVQRQMTSQLQRETAEELRSKFQEQLALDLKDERVRNESAMTKVAEDARKSAFEYCQREAKKNERTRAHHLGALQMLLTSSQEHLSKLNESSSALQLENSCSEDG